jgi:hypothetical protein
MYDPTDTASSRPAPLFHRARHSSLRAYRSSFIALLELEHPVMPRLDAVIKWVDCLLFSAKTAMIRQDYPLATRIAWPATASLGRNPTNL